MKELPENWKAGFSTYPYQIGCGGNETPFLHNGHWYLYVWNIKEHVHSYYGFTEDVFFPNHPDAFIG